MEDEASISGGYDSDLCIHSFSISQTLIFFLSSIFGKIGILLILLSNGLFPLTSMSLPAFYIICSQEFTASILVLAFTFLVLKNIARYPRLTRTFMAMIGFLQFLYLGFIMAYIEYFRLFNTQMNDSLITALYELIQTPKSTIAFTAESYDPWINGIYLLAYCFMIFVIWPRINRIRVKRSLRTSQIVVLLIIFSINVVAYPYAKASITEIVRYDLPTNPLFGLTKTVYYLMSYDLESFDNASVSIVHQNQAEIIIDENFPFMSGTVYAVCSDTRTANNPRFLDSCMLDEDGDGFDRRADCDDENDLVNPNAEEVLLNGFDEDCDGQDNPRLNVLILMMESVISDELEIFNDSYDNTPNLESLRENMYLFENYYSNSGHSISGEFMSYCSMYIPGWDREDERPNLFVPCIQNILRERGYRTAYFSPEGPILHMNTKYFSEEKGFEDIIHRGKIDVDGFMTHDNLFKTPVIEEKALVEPLRNWIRLDGGRPFFAVFRFNTGHSPYIVPEEYHIYDQSKLNAVYYIDSTVGELIKMLEAEGLKNDTLIIITSDHGDGKNRFIPTRIPFILYNPILFKHEMHSERESSQMDLAPTLFDILGIQSINSFLGNSMIDPEEGSEKIFFKSRKGIAWIHDGEYELYYVKDSGERILYQGGIDISSDEVLLGRYVDELESVFDTIKRLKEEDRVFDNSLFPEYSQ